MPSFGWYFVAAFLVLFGLILAVPSEGHGAETAAPKVFGTVGAVVSPGDIGDIIWTNYAKGVAEKSGGRLAVKLLIRGETGGEDGMMTALIRNRIQISSFSEAGMSRIVPEYQLLAAPYLFDSLAEWHFVIDNFLLEPFREMSAARGVYLHEFQDVGWTNVYAKKPLLEPADARGYRMRAMSSLTSAMFLEALGADVIHLQRNELVTSLQTGLVDGGETALVLYARGGEAEYAPHFTLTEHSRTSGTSVFNQAWLDGLSDEDRAIALGAYGDQAAERKEALRLNEVEMARLPQIGVTVHTLSPEQRARWKAQVQGNTAKLIDTIGGRAAEIHAMIVKAKAEFAARNPGG
ncbi:MAG: TRAP transporter substrate-binding protein [Rhodospirillaceae bacterium]|nr:TRAP transporter substrate-binding protein [Rhodospirillaceae bacterium]